MTSLLTKLGVLLCLIVFASCNDTKNTAASTASDSKAVSLFDGTTFKGWHNYNDTGAIKSWTIEDGALVCLGTAKDAHGGDIVTDKEYENFELSWDWKMTPTGNSGLMYHVVEDAKYQATYHTGPEYQMIDDVGFPSKLEEWQKTGADYAMNLPNDKKVVKPVGEWNSSKIIFNKGTVEHWLNGEMIVSFKAWDDKWNKEKATGKWKDFPDYGLAKKGRIALQDHGNKVYFRNIMIKEL